MEGRILRRQADIKAPWPGDGSRDGAAIRRTLGRATTITIAALLLATLTLVTTSIAGVGVSSAKAWSCTWADKSPRHLSTKQARHAIVCVINKQRGKHGRPALRTKRALGKAGKRHSRYMKRHHCFAHQCPGEGDLVSRIHRTSYLPCKCSWRVGETIGWGARRKGTPHAIVHAWMHSPAHRHVLLDRGLRQVGVGIVRGSPSKPGARAATYTADFGLRRK
jgi:uncharacterized protein YkwD